MEELLEAGSELDAGLAMYLDHSDKKPELIPTYNAGSFSLWFMKQMFPTRIRPIYQWAEEELWNPPGGPYGGQRYRLHTQPFNYLWLNELHNNYWREYDAVGPTQSGKTFICFSAPIVYTLMELQLNVICGVPNKDMIKDKWEDDIEPFIANSKYAKYLPSRGPGSQGGTPFLVKFGNGTWLRFMTAGGKVKGMAGKTASRLFSTEVDGFDPNGITIEGSRMDLLKGRLRAHENARIVAECTASIEEGYIWQNYLKGTKSRIAIPCVHCGEYVSPEREDLVGWQEAQNVKEAEANARFRCPACASDWTEDDRRISNQGNVLVHEGQTVDSNGNVHGDLPPVDNLGFRWSAVNNNFVSMASLGKQEWEARQAEDEENADMVQRQQVWALPAKPSQQQLEKLNMNAICKRQGLWNERVAPEDTKYITVGVDVGKHLLYFLALAWRDNGGIHVLEYGTMDVPSKDMEEGSAIEVASDMLADKLSHGWETESGKSFTLDLHLQDASYKTDNVYVFTLSEDSAKPIMGFGDTSKLTGGYTQPRKLTKDVRYIGDHCHTKIITKKIEGRNRRINLVEAGTNHWKSVVHHALAMPEYKPGAVSLPLVENYREHLSFARHMCAEEQVQEFKPGKGYITKWVQRKGANHWFDCMVYAFVAGEMTGAWQLVVDIAAEEAEKGDDTPAVDLDAEKETAEAETPPKVSRRERRKKAQPKRSGRWYQGNKNRWKK